MRIPGQTFIRGPRRRVVGVCVGILCSGLSVFSTQANVRVVVGTDAADQDDKRYFALGMIETGNNDRDVGRAGEVSRFQIHPSVWRYYSASREYQNADLAIQVARQHWNYLTRYFRAKTGREPADFDMYVLWNTRFGYYARRGFDRERLPRIVRDRAQRFVNLIQR